MAPAVDPPQARDAIAALPSVLSLIFRQQPDIHGGNVSQRNDDRTCPRIVVGVDRSDSSREALRWAIRQAGLTGATVEAVIAWHLPLPVGASAWAPLMALEAADLGKLAEKVLTEAIGSAAVPGGAVRIIPVVREGNAAQVLIDAAGGAELLVVGSRGYGGFTEALLGSVSQHCVHHAPCPVVIIRGASCAEGTIRGPDPRRTS